MNSRRPSVLIVDDSPEEAAVYKRYLARGSGQRYRVQQASAGAKAVAMLRRRAPDCVLLDFKLPDMDVIEALRAMAAQSAQSEGLTCAVIVLAEVGEAKIGALAEEAMKFGAHDCLEKSWITPELLRRAVANAIEKAALRREVEERRRELAAKDQTLERRLDEDSLNLTSERFGAGGVVDIAESRLAKEALRESEEKFSKVFRASPHRITIAALDEGRYRYIDVNDAVLRATGYKREEMVGRTTEELQIFAEPEGQNKLLRAFRNRSVRDMEIQLRSKSGEIQTVLLSAEIITIGGRQCFLTVSNDITERKRAEEALRESEERFRTLANTIPSIIWMAEPGGTITFHNQQWLEYSDISPDAEGEWLRLALYPDDLEPCLAEWNRATELECEFEIELRLRRRDGEYRWFLARATPTRDAEGRIANWFGVTTDIHDRKQVEEALRESEERLKLAMEAAGMFVWETDVATGRVKSEFPEAMMGMELGSFGGTFDSFLALVHPDDRESFLEVRKRAFDGEGPYDLELRTVRSDGGVRWGLVRGVVYRDKRGRPARVVGVDMDVTDRKLAEEALQRANRCYQIALDALDGYVYEYNVSDKVSAWSKGLTKLTGFEPGEAEPRADWWFARVHPDDREEVLSMANERLAEESTENTYSFEYRVRHKDGRYIDVLDRSLVVHDAEGRPVQIVGVVINITDRKRAEDVLRESAEHLRLAMEAANAGSFDWDIASGDVVWSPSHYRILGLEAQDGRQAQGLWRDHLHPEDEWIESDMAKALAERRDLNVEYRVVRADGVVRWVNSIGHTFYNDEGEPERMLGLMIDISEKKQAEEKLRESEERLRLALQGAQAGVWEVKFNPPSSYWSEEYRAFYGFSLTDEATREIWVSRVHPDDLQRVEAANEALLSSDLDEMRQEYRIIHPERGLRWILDLVRVRRDEFGRATSYGGINLDVTERRRAEEALRESEERMRQQNAELENIYQAAPIGLSLIDRHFRFIRINEALAEINGASVGQMLGRTVREVTPEMADRLEPIIKWVIKTGQPIMNLDMRGVTAREPGVERDWLVSYYPIKAVDGGVQGIGSVVLDMTDRKQAKMRIEELLRKEQEARAQAEAANRSKDEFIAMVSHELRSPLNAMLGWSKILKKGGVDEKTRTHAAEVIERSARAQQNLIEDLLDMARIAGGRLRLETRAVNLARVVETSADVVRPAATAKEIDLRLSIKSEDEVTGDADRLQQVIWNLLSNAVKFTSHGGSVEVVLERVGASAQITVTDTGRGIKAEDLPFIFDRFRQAGGANTRRFAGLGLGLALVKHLVELHGGTVHAESPGEGQGASFTVKLPVRAIRGETAPGRVGEWESGGVGERGSGRQTERESKADVHRSPALPLSHSPTLPLKGVWALIVDDEADARELVATLLRQYGARVTDASCASEALDKLRKGADGARPDVIISDISMPDEDGYMLIERIRRLPAEEGGNIPAIALTAFERPSDRIKALASGFSMHVPKPVEPEELAMVIANLTAPPGKGTNVR